MKSELNISTSKKIKVIANVKSGAVEFRLWSINSKCSITYFKICTKICKSWF